MAPPHIDFVLGQVAAAEFVLPTIPLLLKQNVTVTLFANPITAARLKTHDIQALPWNEIVQESRPRSPTSPNSRRLLVTSLTYQLEEQVALEQAREKKIKSLGLLDNWYDMHKRLGVGEANKHIPDSVAVIDQYAANRIAMETNDLMIHIVGYPPLDTLPTLTIANSNKILFIDQPISRYPDISPGYDEQDVWHLLLSACGDREIAFAPHPASVWSPGSGVRIETDTLDALNHYGTIAGMYSTVLLHAHLCGRHVLSLQPGRSTEDKFILTERDILPALRNRADIEAALKAETPYDDAFAEGLCGGTDRLTELLMEMVQQ
jgi:hypothetical protein